jgi:hypothetical protein
MRMILSSHVLTRPSALPSRTAAWEPRWEVMVRSLLKMTGTFQILFVILSAVSHARVVDRTELETPNIVIEWDNAALQGVRDSKLGPPMVARALAIVHTCVCTTPGLPMTTVPVVLNSARHCASRMA